MSEGAVVIRVDRGVREVDFGTYSLPATFHATILPEDPTAPRCHLSLSVEDGRVVCDAAMVAVMTGGPKLSGTALRQMPIATYVRRAVLSARRSIPPTGPTPAPRKSTEVARIYLAAYAAGEPPTQAVMREWACSRSTASRLVRSAREAGCLGPAVPRVAGG